MPIPGGIPLYDFKEIANKIAMLMGILVIIYALLWILAELKLIPVVLFAIFPQIVLLLDRNIHCLYSLFQKKQLLILKLFFEKKKKLEVFNLFLSYFYCVSSLEIIPVGSYNVFTTH